MAVTLGDAKILVKLDLEQARKDADALDARKPGEDPAPGAAPAAPDNRRDPHPGGDGPRGRRRGGQEPDGSFNPVDATKRVGQAAVSGGLYGEGLALAGTVPVIGTAVRAAELVRQYGPLAAGLARGVGDSIDDPAIKAAFAQLATMTTEQLNSLATELNGVKALLDSVSVTIERLVTAGTGAAALGGFDVAAFGDFALNMRKVANFEVALDNARRQRGMLLVGQAVGQMSGDGARQLFAGASGR